MAALERFFRLQHPRVRDKVGGLPRFAREKRECPRVETAEAMREIGERPIKKVPTLRGKTV